MLVAGCQTITVEVVDTLGLKNGEVIHATARVTKDTCHIRHIKATFPACMKHEYKHCEEGNWHPLNSNNTEYCNFK